MPQGIPKSGEKYRHFKNKLYQVIAIARHSETGEELVVYQALYGDFGIYARPLSMFISPVEREKYPEVEQTYRFELVKEAASVRKPEPEEEQVSQESEEEQVSQKSEEESRSAGQENITELLMDFYDAGTYDEKYRVLSAMKDDITDVMINNMAVVLDVVIPEGTLEKRYEELKNCLNMRKKYETSRF